MCGVICLANLKTPSQKTRSFKIGQQGEVTQHCGKPRCYPVPLLKGRRDDTFSPLVKCGNTSLFLCAETLPLLHMSVKGTGAVQVRVWRHGGEVSTRSTVLSMCFSRVCSAPAFLRYSLVLVVAAKCTIHTSPPTRPTTTLHPHRGPPEQPQPYNHTEGHPPAWC